MTRFILDPEMPYSKALYHAQYFCDTHNIFVTCIRCLSIWQEQKSPSPCPPSSIVASGGQDEGDRRLVGTGQNKELKCIRYNRNHSSMDEEIPNDY